MEDESSECNGKVEYCDITLLHTTSCQLVNIGSQYSYSSSDQSEFLVIVSRLVDERREKDSHTTVKERVGLIYSIVNTLYVFLLVT